MRELDEEFRARAREFAAGPPQRSAAEAARRARAAAGTVSAGRGSAPRRLAFAAFAVAGAALAVALLAPGGEREERVAARPPAPVARVVEPRLIVIDLASGTRLYVALTPSTPPRRST